MKITSKSKPLTNAEIAEIQRRRPGVRASFAIEGMTYTPEEEALFEQMDAERLTADERTLRIIEFCRFHHEGPK